MKGIYFTTQYSPFRENTNVFTVGIEKKIKKQISVFEQNGYSIEVVNPERPVHTIDKILRRLPIHYEKYDIEKTLVEDSYFMYIRKPLLIDYRMIDYLSEVKKINPTIKILMEIPTFPYDNEIKDKKDIPFLLKDRIARNQLYKYVDVIITYSKDSEIFGIPAINLSNGIDYFELNKYTFEKNNDSKIHVIACACFNFYHGYDRAIKGLFEYVKDNDDSGVVLDIVGDGSALTEYKTLAHDMSLENYVVFHGQLTGEDLARVYNTASIGLDSMGRHRAGVYYNSSLKGKEYCAYGLFIVSGVETELDNNNKFPFYYRIPADESPMDWSSVISFYKKNLEDYGGADKCKAVIKDYAKCNFDMSVAFQPVIDYIG